jgi:hypothetical protein
MLSAPKAEEPHELFLKLCEAKPSEELVYPREVDGHEVKVRVHVLSLAEHNKARIAAHKRLLAEGNTIEQLQSPLLKEVLGDKTVSEVLVLAITDAIAVETDKGPYYRKIFRDARDVEALSANEVTVLFHAYTTVQHKYGPFERTVESADDVATWVRRLGEGGSEFPLLSMPLPQLVEIASSFAAQMYTLSLILESQWSTLPDTFKSSLPSCFTAMSSSGELAANYESTGGGEARDDLLGFDPDEAITLAVARSMAMKLRGIPEP